MILSICTLELLLQILGPSSSTFHKLCFSLMPSENFVSWWWSLMRANEAICFLVMNPPRLFDPLSFV